MGDQLHVAIDMRDELCAVSGMEGQLCVKIDIGDGLYAIMDITGYYLQKVFISSIVTYQLDIWKLSILLTDRL